MAKAALLIALLLVLWPAVSLADAVPAAGEKHGSCPRGHPGDSCNPQNCKCDSSKGLVCRCRWVSDGHGGRFKKCSCECKSSSWDWCDSWGFCLPPWAGDLCDTCYDSWCHLDWLSTDCTDCITSDCDGQACWDDCHSPTTGDWCLSDHCLSCLENTCGNCASQCQGAKK